jgi:hypothetical protein
MLLAEELLLLGLDPVEGTVVNNAGRELLVGLAGALVGELALAGLVDLSGRCFVAVGTPPGDPLLAAAHQALAQSAGRRAAAQLRGLDKGIGASGRGWWTGLPTGECWAAAGIMSPGSPGSPSPGIRCCNRRCARRCWSG